MLSRRAFSFLCGSAAFAQAPAEKIETDWVDARTLTVEGQGFRDTAAPWDRLPARAEALVRKEVWSLSRDSAGICVRFTSNATHLRARWALNRRSLAGPNMTAIGASGLDLYVRTGPAAWRWLGFGRPSTDAVIESPLASGMPAGEREYLLYLPLYNGVKSLEIGVNKGATLQAAAPRPANRKPIVFYGTSITQGASATRPGMCHPAILGRWLDRPVINLGFSGNGRMDAAVGDLLVKIDAAVFVVDCLPNMDAAQVRERTVPLVKQLRAAHPAVPIVLVEDRRNTNSWILPARDKHHTDNHAALRESFAALQREGVKHLHYIAGDGLLGDDAEGATDGSHPSDLGFVRQADVFEPVLRAALGR